MEAVKVENAEENQRFTLDDGCLPKSGEGGTSTPVKDAVRRFVAALKVLVKGAFAAMISAAIQAALTGFAEGVLSFVRKKFGVTTTTTTTSQSQSGVTSQVFSQPTTSPPASHFPTYGSAPRPTSSYNSERSVFGFRP